MAVVEQTSNLVNSYLDAVYSPPDPNVIRGRLIKSTGAVINAATDSSGSSFHLIDLPSDCLLDASTFFKVDDWGFATVHIGTKTDTTALVNQLRSAETIAAPITQGDAFHGKALWEVLGMAVDPGGTIEIYAHAAAGSSGSGSMNFQIAYLYH